MYTRDSDVGEAPFLLLRQLAYPSLIFTGGQNVASIFNTIRLCAAAFRNRARYLKS